MRWLYWKLFGHFFSGSVLLIHYHFACVRIHTNLKIVKLQSNTEDLSFQQIVQVSVKVLNIKNSISGTEIDHQKRTKQTSLHNRATDCVKNMNPKCFKGQTYN